MKINMDCEAVKVFVGGVLDLGRPPIRITPPAIFGIPGEPLLWDGARGRARTPCAQEGCLSYQNSPSQDGYSVFAALAKRSSIGHQCS